jgi:RimJ/RimL family protein N-acetyltransferase
VIPFSVDAQALRTMTDWFDIDLDASRVAFRDGEPVGLANLALRGADAWIGGVGVVPAARRTGVAEELMRAVHDEARARGVHRVWLEVIEQNEAAFRLYDKLGYEVIREVDVLTLDADVEPGSAREAPADEAHSQVHALRDEREPWQRADSTLAAHDDLEGLIGEEGAAVYRRGRRVSLLQIAGSDPDDLLRSLRSRGPLTALNFPRDGAVAAALSRLGANLVVRQREMLLSLA